MSCTGCEETVENAVSRIDSVHRVTADHKTNTVKITAEDDTEEQVEQAIYDAGYDLPA